MGLIFPPMWALVGICVLLALHRSRVLEGKSRGVQMCSYLALASILFVGLSALNQSVQRKVAEGNTAFARLVASFSPNSEARGPAQPTATPSLIGHIDQIDLAAEAGKPLTRVFLNVSIRNRGIPTIAEAFVLRVRLSDGTVIKPLTPIFIPEGMTLWRGGHGKKAIARFSRQNALEDRATLTPIPNGGVVAGWLQFAIDIKLEELQTKRALLTLSFADIVGRLYETEYQIPVGSVGDRPTYIAGSGPYPFDPPQSRGGTRSANAAISIEAHLPPDGEPYGTQFTITNTGDSAFNKYSITCYVRRIVGSGAILDGLAGRHIQAEVPLFGGDQQSLECLSALPKIADVACSDVFVEFAYSADQSSKQVKSGRLFHFVGRRRGGGFQWVRQRVNDPEDFCRPAATSK